MSLTLVLTSTSGIAQQQNLTIRVVDSQNEEAIEYANVFITPCSCGGTTNNQGYVSIGLGPDRYTIITSNIGYASDTLEIEFQLTREIIISLDRQIYNLESVTVTGENNTSNVERTVMGVQQLSAKQLTILPTAIGEVDVFRGLTMLPGVGSAGEASNGISIRGGSLDQNLILFDGAPIFNPTHLFGLFSVFTPDAISSVDLYRANIPARFGGRTSSVVDVRVKSPSLNDFKLTGGIGLVSSRLGVETPIVRDKLGALASVRVAQNDFLFRFSNRLKNTKANFIDGTLKLNWNLGKNDNIYWTSFYSQDFYQLDITTNINNINADANQYDYSIFNNTLNWLHTFKNKGALQANLVWSLYNPKILFPQTQNDNVITYESAIDYRSLLLKYSQDDHPSFKYAIGIQGVQTVLDPGRLLPGNENGLIPIVLQEEQGVEVSGFVESEWIPSDRLAISTGLRYTQYLLMGPYETAKYSDPYFNDISETESFPKGETVTTLDGIEPRVGLRWRINPSTSLKASYARTIQYLQNIYNSATPVPTSRWKYSDPYVLPQRANTYSLGVYQNVNSNQILLSLEGYYRQIDHVLDYKPGADFFLQEFIEQDILQGMGKTYGVEFAFQKPEGIWNGWFNYTWSRSYRKFDTDELASQINNNEWYVSDFDRPHVINGTINFRANEFNTFSANFTLQSGRPYSIPNAVFRVDDVVVPVFLERNNARLPAYHRLDFSWRIHNASTKKNKRWKGDWIFTIYNVYNRKNPYSIYYGGLTPNFSENGVGAYQLSIFNSTVVSMAYSFIFD